MCEGKAEESEWRPDMKVGKGAEVSPKQIAETEDEDVDGIEEKWVKPRADGFDGGGYRRKDGLWSTKVIKSEADSQDIRGRRTRVTTNTYAMAIS